MKQLLFCWLLFIAVAFTSKDNFKEDVQAYVTSLNVAAKYYATGDVKLAAQLKEVSRTLAVVRSYKDWDKRMVSDEFSGCTFWCAVAYGACGETSACLQIYYDCCRRCPLFD